MYYMSPGNIGDLENDSSELLESLAFCYQSVGNAHLWLTASQDNSVNSCKEWQRQHHVVKNQSSTILKFARGALSPFQMEIDDCFYHVQV